MIHNNKVYANADDKFVKGVLAYCKMVDGKNILFYDKDCTKPVSSDKLFELYIGGLYVYGEGDLGSHAYELISLYQEEMNCLSSANHSYIYGVEPTEE